MSESAAAPSTDRISLRDVTAEDAEFLGRVYASTREQELVVTNWSDEQKTQFCRMQFNAQTTDYRANYPHARHSVIERNGAGAGRLYVERAEREIRIIDIALLPEARGAGIGTRLLRELMEEAGAAGKPLTIHVEKFNPALRLYLRLGFRAIEDKGVYLLMEWRA
jgi:ribosomal protein S18 acetylase RimI-like enzyme